MKNLRDEKDKLEIKYEMKVRELQLRIRGLEEEEEEDVRDKVVNIMAELLELSPEEVESKLDHVFRIRSSYATKNKRPRDIIVNVMSKKMRDQIVLLSSKNPIEYKEKKVLILKELPRQVLAERKKYRKLTNKLKRKDVRFKWEMPTGLSFTYDDVRYKILSEAQTDKFLSAHEKDFDNGMEA